MKTESEPDLHQHLPESIESKLICLLSGESVTSQSPIPRMYFIAMLPRDLSTPEKGTYEKD